MKAKNYRLETVLEIRRRAKEEAARRVALRLQQLDEAETELNRRQIKLQTCYEQQNRAQSLMNEELIKGIQARNILSHQNYLNDLRKIEIEQKSDVEKQILAVAKAEKEVEKAREFLIEAARDLKSIEVHKENWQSTENNEQTRREQRISDEIGSILHTRRKS